MDETANTTHQNEPSGIFDPKPIQTDKLPLTGPQKAIRPSTTRMQSCCG